MLSREKIKQGAVNWLNNYPDDRILNWLFSGVLIATISVVGLDYYEMLNGSPSEEASISSPMPFR